MVCSLTYNKYKRIKKIKKIIVKRKRRNGNAQNYLLQILILNEIISIKELNELIEKFKDLF